MIRLFTGCVLLACALGLRAQQLDASAGPKTLQGASGTSVQSAVVNFLDLVAEQKKSDKAAVTRPAKPFLGIRATGELVERLNRPVTAADQEPSPLPDVNFLGTIQNAPIIPPDTDGAVGPRHIVVAVNTEVKIMSRTGNQVSSVSLDQFWSRLNNSFTFDPHIQFDQVSQRWIITASADANSAAAGLLIGASKTDDPTGAWNLYKLTADPTGAYWGDYPALGFNKDWIVVSVNYYRNTDDRNGPANVFVINKDSVLSGANAATYKQFSEPTGFTMSPAVTFDSAEPTIWIIENFGIKNLRISSVTGPVGAETLNVGVATVTSPSLTWNLGGASLGAQLGTQNLIECNDPRILNTVFRNGSIYTTHTVFFPANSFPTSCGAQWWQVTPDGKILQQGLISDPSGTANYAFPSIAVNKKNDVLVGFSKFTPSTYASAGYAFHGATDATGSMRGDTIYKPGEATYFEDRWGDYSSTVVDPLNDLDMWTLQEYAAPAVGGFPDGWGVWWAKVKVASPPDGVLDLVAVPVNNSDIAAGQPTDFFVTVSDGSTLVNTASVVAKIAGRADVSFRNDGQGADAVAGDNVYSATITLTASDKTVVFAASAPGFVSGTTTNIYNVVPQPPNDNFANATKVPAAGAFGLNVLKVANNFATTEVDEPLHAGVSNARSLWWTYSTDVAQRVLLDASGTAPQVVLAVYTGTSLSTLTSVVFTNPPPNKPAVLSFDAVPGVTYRIAIAGKNAAQKGAVRLRVQPNGNPDVTSPILNVDFPISGMVTNSDTITFTGTVVDPNPDPSGVAAVTIELGGEEPQVVQALISGTTWSATLPLEEGENRFIITAVDFADNFSDSFKVVVYNQEVGTTNDLFGFARQLSGNSGVDFASNTNATREFQEPLFGGNEGGRSLWWYYVPPADGILLLSTEGSSFDTLLGLFTVDDPVNDRSVTDLHLVAQNDDSPDNPPTGGTGFSELTAAVEGGKLYYIAVDGYGGASGTIRLEYNLAPVGVFKVTTSVSSAGGGTISPGSGTFPSGGALTVQAFPDRYKQFKDFRVTSAGVTTIVTQDPYTFQLEGPTDVVAEFETKVFADDFESGALTKLPYLNPSNYWTVATVVTNIDTGATTKAARVIPNLPDSRTASLVLNTNLAAGTGSFEFSVNTEKDFDKFEFLLDDRILGTWSGNVPWTLFQFDIPAKSGTTKLEWRYVKDLAVTVANELVAIDNIDLKFAAPPTPTAANISIKSSPPTLTVTGTAGTDYQLQTSTDLVNWAPAPGVNEATANSSGVATFNLPVFSSGQRYYRVVGL